MKTARWTLALIFSGVLCLTMIAPEAPASLKSKNGLYVSDVTGSVVRIISHGGSGTVILTNPSWSLILSCSHMFANEAHLGGLTPDPKALAKPLVIDAPWPAPAGPKKVKIELLAVDFKRDLSLIVLYYGNAPYVLPVAPLGHRPSKDILSAGYDDMRPITIAGATILQYGTDDLDELLTKEPPWHGRSGGALIDNQAGVLIGVVQGYYGPYPYGNGIYVCLKSIHVFLKTNEKYLKADPRVGLPPSSIVVPAPRAPKTTPGDTIRLPFLPVPPVGGPACPS